MKRTLVSMVTVLAVAGVLSVARAADSRQVTLKGDLQCTKCSLNETKNCSNVLVVKEGDKSVNYYLTRNGVSKAYDEKTCGGKPIKVTAQGTVAEKDGKKNLTATKITEG